MLVHNGFQPFVIVHTGTRRKGGALLVISKLNFFATNYTYIVQSSYIAKILNFEVSRKFVKLTV